MKVYKIRRKSDGKFSSGHHRYNVLWDQQGKLWFRLSHLQTHLDFIKRCDGHVTSQYGNCEIITFELMAESIEDIPL